MKVNKILDNQRPKKNKSSNYNINNKRIRKDKKEENLSFSDVMELMKHDSYKRHRGALRQK